MVGSLGVHQRRFLLGGDKKRLIEPRRNLTECIGLGVPVVIAAVARTAPHAEAGVLWQKKCPQKQAGIDTTIAARSLWLKNHPLPIGKEEPTSHRRAQPEPRLSAPVLTPSSRLCVPGGQCVSSSYIESAPDVSNQDPGGPFSL